MPDYKIKVLFDKGTFMKFIGGKSIRKRKRNPSITNKLLSERDSILVQRLRSEIPIQIKDVQKMYKKFIE